EGFEGAELALGGGCVEGGEKRAEHSGNQQQHRQREGEDFAQALRAGGDVFNVVLDGIENGDFYAMLGETLFDDPFLVLVEKLVELALGSDRAGAAAVESNRDWVVFGSKGVALGVGRQIDDG